VSGRARYIVSRIRLILEKNSGLLRDVDVRNWLRITYPLLLEHASIRDKEFFKTLSIYLFNKPHKQLQ